MTVENKRIRRKVKWFNNDKGFGFLNYTESEDIFVHYSAILGDGYKTLEANDEVEFDLITTEKGLQAKNIELIHSEILEHC